MEIEIFKTGYHTAMNGVGISFGEADLQATAENYDSIVHEAPLVVGHPKNNSPAYGWVKSLRYENGILKATPYQVDPAFAEMVRAGRFKKVSASFYSPDSPHNPVSGVYSLRHVGFLGASPPAVKGLKDANFSEDDNHIFIEFGECKCMLNEADLQAKEEELSLREAAIKKAEATNFVENLIDQGRILLVQKLGLIEFMIRLDDSVELEFTEGNQLMINWFRKFLKSLPKQIEFGEIKYEENLSMTPKEVATKARELVFNKKIKGSNISFSEAVNQIMRATE